MDEYKKEALDLINSFYYALPNNGYMDHGLLSCSRRYEEGKKCALICVDKLINAATPHCWECGGGNKEYWEKVKVELLKMNEVE